MYLSIVIPAYNEEKRLKPSLDTVYDFLKKQNFESEIIVVNDGSTDKTKDIIEEFHKEIKNQPEVKIVPLSYPVNRGKGYATKIGALTAKGDFIYLCDADLSTPITELSKFLEYEKGYDIVIGSRALSKSNVKTSPLRKALGRIGNFLINSILVKNISDTQSGFKLFDKKIKKLFEMQKIERWGFDFELLYLAQKKGFKIVEIPVEWTNMKFSKVKPIHYVTTLLELLKIKLSKYNLNVDNKKN